MSDATPNTASKATGSASRHTVSKRVKFIDKTADLLIRTGGVGVIIIVALIFIFITLQTLPLFRGAQQKEIFSKPLPENAAAKNILALGIDEYESLAYTLDASNGTISTIETTSQKKISSFAVPALKDTRATAAYRTPSRDKLFIGAANGTICLVEAKFDVTYDSHAERSVSARFVQVAAIEAVADGSAVAKIHGRLNGNGDWIYVFSTADGRVFTGKFIDGEPAETPQEVGGKISGKILALLIDYEGNRLFVSTDAKKLYQYYLDDNRDAAFRSYDFDANITAMEYSIGDVALLLGFSDGRVQQWFGVREKETDVLKPIHKIRSFDPLTAAITTIQTSARDKGFAVGAADGSLHLKFTTSGRTLLKQKLPAGIHSLAYAPKLTALLALSEENTLRLTQIDNPHPEISFGALFGSVHYEGYDEPDYIWQSTGGTDDFESKLSLVPLAIGTVKGAFYGLLFAIPLAVFGALYTSQFMAPEVRAYIKPTIEIMAALPSVVVGFLAGLWLAPLLDEIMVGTLLMIIVVPVTVLIGSSCWFLMPRSVRHRVSGGHELLLLLPLVLLGFWIAQELGPVVEHTFFNGNYKQWAFDVFGKQVEQRNSIVIGIAMGFAVIPIIFTISEDAFSNVPTAFKSASYALGASRWQTAWRVIVPTASPGVFSAVMIGFGRAVGETMIVLMATGNTPILSFSPFNGMRTLSANIAVEIPEAPVDGTLYRVLFVAALMLFGLTFICNTIAEVVRQRLREKYQAV